LGENQRPYKIVLNISNVFPVKKNKGIKPDLEGKLIKRRLL
jgi:hypothetical protein